MPVSRRKGKKHTEETKAKIKESAKKATASPEKRAKMSEAAKKWRKGDT